MGCTSPPQIPPELDGAYARNGPNAAMDPRGGYHPFDGDGMVHVCRIRDGRVSYANRYVRTEKLQDEWRLGGPFHIRVRWAVAGAYLGIVWWGPCTLECFCACVGQP